MLAFFLVPNLSTAQKRKKKKTVVTEQYPKEIYSSMQYRLLGPFRGGRSAAVTGVPNQPNLFYFGATGGGSLVSYDNDATTYNLGLGRRFNEEWSGAVTASRLTPTKCNPLLITINTQSHQNTLKTLKNTINSLKNTKMNEKALINGTLDTLNIY